MKACTFQKKVATIVRPDQAAGNLIPFKGKVGGRKLRPGRYTATFIVTDAAGNVSNAVSLVFKIVRKRRASGVRLRGLEPPRGYPHGDLNAARLPSSATAADGVQLSVSAS